MRILNIPIFLSNQSRRGCIGRTRFQRDFSIESFDRSERRARFTWFYNSTTCVIQSKAINLPCGTRGGRGNIGNGKNEIIILLLSHNMQYAYLMSVNDDAGSSRLNIMVYGARRACTATRWRRHHCWRLPVCPVFAKHMLSDGTCT